MQSEDIGFGFARKLRKRREARAFERASRWGRELREKAIRGTFLHHTSWTYWMNPRFFATLS
jgi:hypothetical protein